MADTRPMSPNCARAQGKPAREHVCTGCAGCSCHAVRPPKNFRQLAEQQRAQRRGPSSPGTVGKDRPGLDEDGAR